MADKQFEFDHAVKKQPDVTGAQLQYKLSVLIEKWSVVAEKLKLWERR